MNMFCKNILTPLTWHAGGPLIVVKENLVMHLLLIDEDSFSSTHSILQLAFSQVLKTILVPNCTPWRLCLRGSKDHSSSRTGWSRITHLLLPTDTHFWVVVSLSHKVSHFSPYHLTLTYLLICWRDSASLW
jgi:hypothetical protein